MSPSPQSLKEKVLSRIAECRQGLQAGKADLAGVEEGVRAYCAALAALPSGAARTHAKDLEALARVVEELNVELIGARDAVYGDLDALDRLRQASAAYQRSDAMSRQYAKNKKGAS